MAPLFLLALFLTYQVSITMFTHVHIINGVMIVHSHPSSDDHHTHTAGQVITIAHIGSYQTPEPEAGVSNVTVECPLLYVLGLNTNTFRAVAPHTHLWGIERSGFFNGREKWAKGFENQRV